MGLDVLVTKMEEVPTFAPCLPVPNVQEIAKKNPLEIPERYVRTEEEIEKFLYKPQLSHDIPIIDFALLSDGNKEELLKLDIACKEWGFFQIVNHGMQKDLMQRMKSIVAEFFELPIEEKNKYAMPADDIQGYGHTSVVSEKQILDWSDQLILLVYPIQFRKLQFWPQIPIGFRDIIEAYSSEIKRVGEELISSLSVILGLEKDVLVGLHKEVVQGLRVNYYPPCNTPEKVWGLSPHTDASTITLVMQDDDDVTGLEIRYKGSWVPVTPIPDALVVNVGDAIELWSNAKYKSVEHRAMTNKNKRRTSFVSFLFPRDDAEVEAFDHMIIDAENPKVYHKVTYGEYLRHTLNRKLQGKTQTDVAKIK